MMACKIMNLCFITYLVNVPIHRSVIKSMSLQVRSVGIGCITLNRNMQNQFKSTISDI